MRFKDKFIPNSGDKLKPNMGSRLDKVGDGINFIAQRGGKQLYYAFCPRLGNVYDTLKDGIKTKNKGQIIKGLGELIWQMGGKQTAIVSIAQLPQTISDNVKYDTTIGPDYYDQAEVLYNEYKPDVVDEIYVNIDGTIVSIDDILSENEINPKLVPWLASVRASEEEIRPKGIMGFPDAYLDFMNKSLGLELGEGPLFFTKYLGVDPQSTGFGQAKRLSYLSLPEEQQNLFLDDLVDFKVPVDNGRTTIMVPLFVPLSIGIEKYNEQKDNEETMNLQRSKIRDKFANGDIPMKGADGAVGFAYAVCYQKNLNIYLKGKLQDSNLDNMYSKYFVENKDAIQPTKEQFDVFKNTYNSQHFVNAYTAVLWSTNPERAYKDSQKQFLVNCKVLTNNLKSKTNSEYLKIDGDFGNSSAETADKLGVDFGDGDKEKIVKELNSVLATSDCYSNENKRRELIGGLFSLGLEMKLLIGQILSNYASNGFEVRHTAIDNLNKNSRETYANGQNMSGFNDVLDVVSNFETFVDVFELGNFDKKQQQEFFVELWENYILPNVQLSIIMSSETGLIVPDIYAKSGAFKNESNTSKRYFNYKDEAGIDRQLQDKGNGVVAVEFIPPVSSYDFSKDSYKHSIYLQNGDVLKIYKNTNKNLVSMQYVGVGRTKGVKVPVEKVGFNGESDFVSKIIEKYSHLSGVDEVKLSTTLSAVYRSIYEANGD